MNLNIYSKKIVSYSGDVNPMSVDVDISEDGDAMDLEDIPIKEVVSVGLYNEYNQCYMNAAIQILIHMPGFTDYLQRLIENSGNQEVLMLLQNLFDIISKKNQLGQPELSNKVLSIMKRLVKESFGMLNMLDTNQHDTHEVLAKIFEKISYGTFYLHKKLFNEEGFDRLSPPERFEMLMLTLEGKTGEDDLCNVPMLDIASDGDNSVENNNLLALQDCIDNFFCKSECVLANEDGSPNITHQKYAFSGEKPEHIVLALNRTMKDNARNNTLVSVPEDKIVMIGGASYRIYAVVNHKQDNFFGGHYTAHIDQDGKNYFNDIVVTNVPFYIDEKESVIFCCVLNGSDIDKLQQNRKGVDSLSLTRLSLNPLSNKYGPERIFEAAKYYHDINSGIVIVDINLLFQTIEVLFNCENRVEHYRSIGMQNWDNEYVKTFFIFLDNEKIRHQYIVFLLEHYNELSEENQKQMADLIDLSHSSWIEKRSNNTIRNFLLSPDIIKMFPKLLENAVNSGVIEALQIVNIEKAKQSNDWSFLAKELINASEAGVNDVQLELMNLYCEPQESFPFEFSSEEINQFKLEIERYIYPDTIFSIINTEKRTFIQPNNLKGLADLYLKGINCTQNKYLAIAILAHERELPIDDKDGVNKSIEYLKEKNICLNKFLLLISDFNLNIKCLPKSDNWDGFNSYNSKDIKDQCVELKKQFIENLQGSNIGSKYIEDDLLLNKLFLHYVNKSLFTVGLNQIRSMDSISVLSWLGIKFLISLDMSEQKISIKDNLKQPIQYIEETVLRGSFTELETKQAIAEICLKALSVVSKKEQIAMLSDLNDELKKISANKLNGKCLLNWIIDCKLLDKVLNELNPEFEVNENGINILLGLNRAKISLSATLFSIIVNLYKNYINTSLDVSSFGSLKSIRYVKELFSINYNSEAFYLLNAIFNKLNVELQQNIEIIKAFLLQEEKSIEPVFNSEDAYKFRFNKINEDLKSSLPILKINLLKNIYAFNEIEEDKKQELFLQSDDNYAFRDAVFFSGLFDEILINMTPSIRTLILELISYVDEASWNNNNFVNKLMNRYYMVVLFEDDLDAKIRSNYNKDLQLIIYKGILSSYALDFHDSISIFFNAKRLIENEKTMDTNQELKKLILATIKHWPDYFERLSDQDKSCPATIKLALEQNGRAIEFIDKKHLTEDMIFIACKTYTYALNKLSKKMRDKMGNERARAFYLKCINLNCKNMYVNLSKNLKDKMYLLIPSLRAGMTIHSRSINKQNFYENIDLICVDLEKNDQDSPLTKYSLKHKILKDLRIMKKLVSHNKYLSQHIDSSIITKCFEKNDLDLVVNYLAIYILNQTFNVSGCIKQNKFSHEQLYEILTFIESGISIIKMIQDRFMEWETYNLLNGAVVRYPSSNGGSQGLSSNESNDSYTHRDKQQKPPNASYLLKYVLDTLESGEKWLISDFAGASQQISSLIEKIETMTLSPALGRRRDLLIEKAAIELNVRSLNDEQTFTDDWNNLEQHLFFQFLKNEKKYLERILEDLGFQLLIGCIRSINR